MCSRTLAVDEYRVHEEWYTYCADMCPCPQPRPGRVPIGDYVDIVREVAGGAVSRSRSWAELSQ